MMSDPNVKKLRRQAYKMWGLKPKQVIYNTPTSYGFKFKIDFSEGRESWPKSYTISKPDGEEIERVIMPILLINNIKGTKIFLPGWYDSPKHMNKIIADLISKPLYRKLTIRQKFLNLFLSKDKKYHSLVPVEDYIFTITIKGRNMIVTLD